MYHVALSHVFHCCAAAKDFLYCLFNQANILFTLTEKVSYILYDRQFHIKLNMHFKAMAEKVAMKATSRQ